MIGHNGGSRTDDLTKARIRYVLKDIVHRNPGLRLDGVIHKACRDDRSRPLLDEVYEGSSLRDVLRRDLDDLSDRGYIRIIKLTRVHWRYYPPDPPPGKMLDQFFRLIEEDQNTE